jgi:type II restriction enzyme
VKKSQDWPLAKVWDGSRALKSRDIIDYINQNFEEQISKGSYDDIRRKDLKLPVLAGLIVRSANDPDSARNDPTRAYALSPEYGDIVRAYGGQHWIESAEEFMSSRPTLSDRLSNERITNLIPVMLPDGVKIEFSPGEHNLLQKAIVEEFLPRFGYAAEVLYVGDTADKYLFLNSKGLSDLKFFEIAHGELPDVVAYSKDKNWLYLIEAVHSSGPISPTRLLELKGLTQDCTAEIVYVTAFLSRDTFRKFAPDIAWETEVWIADAPDHIIHFNGERFLGPYANKY